MANPPKVIFLDRDGVINEEPGERLYVMRWKDFHFLPRAKGAIKKLTDAGYRIFIISNQAGVGKGLYTKKMLDTITKNMISEIKKSGGDIESAYYCTHRSEDNCDCRKPKTGLFEQALRGFLNKYGSRTTPRLHSGQADDGSRSIINDAYFIGDDRKDIEAGDKFGCRSALVLTGKTKRGDIADFKIKPDLVARDLKEAVNKILK